MPERAFEDVGDNLHVCVPVPPKPGTALHAMLVDHKQVAEPKVARVAVAPNSCAASPGRPGNASRAIWRRWPTCRPRRSTPAIRRRGGSARRRWCVPLVGYKTDDHVVPVAFSHREKWIRGHDDAVVIGSGGEIVVGHPRCCHREDMVFDPIRYLPLIGKKINALE